jgi:peptide/nickel transport system substrate-binding protein
MPTRRLLTRVLTALIVVSALACGSSSKAKEGSSNNTGSVMTDQALTTTKGNAASTTTGPRGVPAGKVTYGWHLTIPPLWLDPQEAQNVITPYAIIYALHDSMIKHFPGQQLQPSLAESYKLADDYKSATFTIRAAAKFQNGDPVTSEDVKFTYENYRGTQAKLFKDRTERIETPDARTITFYFKEPFLDFLLMYGTPATGIGWIVPKKYYQQVGPDGYKQKPIGAGPYKLVRNTSFTELEFEAMPDYWRKSPHVKTVVFKVMTDDATRFAALQTGEVDFINVIPGALLDAAKKNSQITLAQVSTAPWWLELVGWDKPNSPFHDVRVRQAVSLALNRKEINDAETGGFSRIDEGNWIPQNLDGALQKQDINPDWYAFDLPRAKKLMAEAGYPNGFEVQQLTPLAPYWPLAERIITQLAEIGIKTKLNKMERATMVDLMTKGVDALPGMTLYASGLNGDAAARIRAFGICGGASSRTCVPEADAKFAQYEKSTDPAERTRLIKEVQKIYSDLYAFPYVYSIGLTMAQGPRIVNDWHEIWFAVPQYPYIYPWEDVRLKG